MSASSQLKHRLLDESEVTGPVSESSRPTEPRSCSVPPPPTDDVLSAFELEELEQLEDRDAATGFDFHDTIPAPPWLDEFGEAENEASARLSSAAR